MTAAPRVVRWQTFVDTVAQAAYVDRLQAYLDRTAGPGFRYEVVGMRPPAGHMHPLTELRCAVQMIDNARDAEADGCAAFVTGHFPDPAIGHLRAALRIPVLGLGEASLLTACMLATRIGIVTIHPAFVPITRDQLARLGLTERVAGIDTMRLTLGKIARGLQDAEAYAAVVAELESAASRLVRAGAELIVPGSGTQLMFTRTPGLRPGGAPMLDGLAALVSMIETRVRVDHRRWTRSTPRVNVPRAAVPTTTEEQSR